MATLVQLSGLPGTGKTAGFETLNPETTYVIDTDKKGLSWAGWKKSYSVDKKNYAPTSDGTDIYKLVMAIVEKRPEINTICIDTITSIMNDKEIEDAKRPGFDKWVDLTKEIYELYSLLREIKRDDLVIFVTAHVEPYGADGETRWRTKTSGKALTKFNLSSKLNYNLYTHVEHTGNGENAYYFTTQTNGKNEARSPKGVLEYKIPNDCEAIRKRIIESES